MYLIQREGIAWWWNCSCNIQSGRSNRGMIDNPINASTRSSPYFHNQFWNQENNILFYKKSRIFVAKIVSPYKYLITIGNQNKKLNCSNGYLPDLKQEQCDSECLPFAVKIRIEANITLIQLSLGGHTGKKHRMYLRLVRKSGFFEFRKSRFLSVFGGLGFRRKDNAMGDVQRLSRGQWWREEMGSRRRGFTWRKAGAYYQDDRSGYRIWNPRNKWSNKTEYIWESHYIFIIK